MAPATTSPRPPHARLIPTRFHVLRVVLGLVLLGAAGLKIHSLFLGSSVRDSLLSSPRLQVATIEVELLLGVWLLSGWWLVVGGSVDGSPGILQYRGGRESLPGSRGANELWLFRDCRGEPLGHAWA